MQGFGSGSSQDSVLCLDLDPFIIVLKFFWIHIRILFQNTEPGSRIRIRILVKNKSRNALKYIY